MPEYPWRVKQRQADEHLRRFAEDCAEYVRVANVGFRFDRDPTAGTIRVTLQADAEPPLSLGAIIGDVLHNLRSALDSVAWATCEQAGPLTSKQQSRIYFPITTDPAKWDEEAEGKLPKVDPAHQEVFRRLQPWFWDEEARALGVPVVPSADKHPLARLHRLANIDRHRVPHPVLARAGDTWLSGPEGVAVTLTPAQVRRAKPGDVVLEWRIDPPSAVSEFHPSGEAVLALSDEAAQHRRSALHELQAMQQEVIRATRRVEIDVLEVVKPAELDELDRLREASDTAAQALRALEDAPHVIDAAHMERYGRAVEADLAARTAYLDRWRELFD